VYQNCPPMKNHDELMSERSRVQSALADAEFEQFAVCLGCAPQQMEDLNKQVNSSRQELQNINSEISRAEAAARQLQQAAAKRRSRRIKLSDADVDIAFADLLSRLNDPNQC